MGRRDLEVAGRRHCPRRRWHQDCVRAEFEGAMDGQNEVVGTSVSVEDSTINMSPALKLPRYAHQSRTVVWHDGWYSLKMNDIAGVFQW